MVNINIIINYSKLRVYIEYSIDYLIEAQVIPTLQSSIQNHWQWLFKDAL